MFLDFFFPSPSLPLFFDPLSNRFLEKTLSLHDDDDLSSCSSLSFIPVFGPLAALPFIMGGMFVQQVLPKFILFPLIQINFSGLNHCSRLVTLDVIYSLRHSVHSQSCTILHFLLYCFELESFICLEHFALIRSSNSLSHFVSRCLQRKRLRDSVSHESIEPASSNLLLAPCTVSS